MAVEVDLEGNTALHIAAEKANQEVLGMVLMRVLNLSMAEVEDMLYKRNKSG